MNALEAGKILAILAAVDRREIDTTTAQGWAWALEDIEYERGLEAAKRAVKSGAGYVDVTAIRRELKAMQPGFERDVRSAKARGIVSDSWPATKPLPLQLEQQLRAAQAAAYEATNDLAEDVLASAPTRAELGA